MQDDDHPDDEASSFGEPLHPDDRLWRHPSEMRSVPPAGARSIPDTVDFAPAPAPSRRRVAWSTLIASSLVGASAALLAVVATGMGDRVVERIVETPPAASPTSLVPVASSVDRSGPAEAVAAALPGIAHLTVVTADGTIDASAVVVRADGYLVTDASVVADATEVLVDLPDGTHLPGEIVGIDPVTALAVVSVAATDLAVIDHGDRADLAVGQWAMAIGSHEDGGPSVSSGAISAVQQRAENVAGTVLYGLIRFDAPIPTEVAGGPLVDDTGAVVGITVKAAEGSPFGWATPIDQVRRVADDIIERGHARHAWLGVEGRRTTDGALVTAVVGGSPAEAAGLRDQDVLVAVDGQPLPSMGTLAALIRERQPGDTLAITYLRDGERHTAVATLDERS